uniref:Uncharacterized protein n=1 Tax=Setaria digitata TaxID=48799 RepID=A0A915PMQ1_9BILA
MITFAITESLEKEWMVKGSLEQIRAARFKRQSATRYMENPHDYELSCGEKKIQEILMKRDLTGKEVLYMLNIKGKDTTVHLEISNSVYWDEKQETRPPDKRMSAATAVSDFHSEVKSDYHHANFVSARSDAVAARGGTSTAEMPPGYPVVAEYTSEIDAASIHAIFYNRFVHFVIKGWTSCPECQRPSEMGDIVPQLYFDGSSDETSEMAKKMENYRDVLRKLHKAYLDNAVLEKKDLDSAVEKLKLTRDNLDLKKKCMELSRENRALKELLKMEP